MRHVRSVLAVLATLLCLHSTAALASTEADFWRWFQRNEAMLFDFEKDQERIFDKVTAQLQKVRPGLTFEFSSKKDGKREFIVSADGVREIIPAVERLVAAAPVMPKWTVIKFRQRSGEPFEIGYGNVNVKSDAVTALLKPNSRRVDVTLLVPGYAAAEHKVYLSIAFLLLDGALGEYDVMTRVGHVDVRAPTAADTAAVTFEKLPAAFDAHFPKR